MITFSIIKDIEECRKLWEENSAAETLFDKWEYRCCLFDEKHYEPYFIVGREGMEIEGILPLWRVINENWFEFFGGYFTERNKFFVKDKANIPLFLNEIPERTCLSYIEGTEAKHAEMKQSDSRYFIELDKCGHSLEGYLAAFSSKHRKNLRRDMEQLHRQGYQIHHNRLSDYERMAELNKLRFGDESFFAEKLFIDGFRRLVNTAKERGELHMLSIEANGIVEAVEVAVLYNSNYNVLMGGNNIAASNIGKLMTLEHIKNAIKQGANQVDFLSTDTGWKKLWKMSEEEVYEFTNMTETQIIELLTVAQDASSQEQ
ncbi:MAG: GNAT family N-acetyltransferase [Candidatus Woesearchaeota archaeon]